MLGMCWQFKCYRWFRYVKHMGVVTPTILYLPAQAQHWYLRLVIESSEARNPDFCAMWSVKLQGALHKLL